MNVIGAIATPPPTVAHPAVQSLPKQDKGRDEATEPRAVQAAEAASPHKVDIKV
jgi:hypothetical protein